MKYLTSKEKELLDLINLNKENPINGKLCLNKKSIHIYMDGIILI